MRSSAKLRIGVVGLGFGASVHVPGLRALPDVEVVALLGSKPERAQAIADRLAVPAARDLDEFLRCELDAVSVAVPPHAVEEVVLPVLAAGRPVLCEKPLGSDLASAQRLAAAAENMITAVDFQFGELCTFSKAREIVTSGMFGEVRAVTVAWTVQSFAHKALQFSWKTDAGLNGGVLNILGSHALFCLEAIAGRISHLFARLDNKCTLSFAPRGAHAAEDIATLTAHHESGALTTLFIGNSLPGLPRHLWIISCERGSIVLENDGADYMSGFRLCAADANGKEVISMKEPFREGDGRMVPFQRLARRFVAAVRADRPCTPCFRAGVRNAQLINVVRQSAYQGTMQAV